MSDDDIFTIPTLNDYYKQCKLGDLKSCAYLVKNEIVNKHHLELKNEELCPLALDLTEKQFQEYGKAMARIEKAGYSQQDLTMDIKRDYQKPLDTIEEACLEFPLIDCVKSQEVSAIFKKFKMKQHERYDQEKLRACVIVMPGQDSQIVLFGRAHEIIDGYLEMWADDEIIQDKLERERTDWTELLKGLPAMQDVSDKQQYKISDTKVIEIIKKTGNIYDTEAKNMETINCIHPALIVDGKPYYTRDELRKWNLKMPARMRLEELKNQVKAWWFSDFDKESMNQWYHQDLENLYNNIRHINQKFPSERSMNEHLNDEILLRLQCKNSWSPQLTPPDGSEGHHVVKHHRIWVFYDPADLKFYYTRSYFIDPSFNLNWGSVDYNAVYGEFMYRYEVIRAEWNENENRIQVPMPLITTVLDDFIRASKNSPLYKHKTEQGIIMSLKFPEQSLAWHDRNVFDPMISKKQLEMTGVTAITTSYFQELETVFGIPTAEANELAKTMRASRALINTNFDYSTAERAMEMANIALGGYGVEGIRVAEYYVNQFWFNTIALYVNIGDTYDTTIVYDTEENTFNFQSWGNWYEQWEIEHPEFREE